MKRNPTSKLDETAERIENANQPNENKLIFSRKLDNLIKVYPTPRIALFVSHEFYPVLCVLERVVKGLLPKKLILGAFFCLYMYI